MRPDRGGPAKYARIAADLRARIVAGQYPAGSAVPSEPAIVDEWGVSKTTASRALDLLAAEGVITRRPGTGSFVIEAPSMVVVRAGPGTRVSAAAGDGEDWPPGTPALYVRRPGAALPERYRADMTVIEFAGLAALPGQPVGPP